MTQEERSAAHESASIQETPAGTDSMLSPVPEGSQSLMGPSSPAEPTPAAEPAPAGTSTTEDPTWVSGQTKAGDGPSRSNAGSLRASPTPGSTDSEAAPPTGAPATESAPESDAPAQGESKATVESAAGPVNHDTLLDMARVPEDRRSALPADPTVVKTFPGPNGTEIEAASTPGIETGPFGMALPGPGVVAGGNVRQTLQAPAPDPAALNVAFTKERAALLSPIGQRLIGFIGRQPADWGVLGPGDVVRGYNMLLDLHSGQKVEAMDGHVIQPGKLYANIRNFPESLATGDAIEQILGTV